MSKFIAAVFLLFGMGILLYLLGRANCRTEVLSVEKEVKRDVVQQKARIYAAPAAGRAQLLKLMYDGIL